MDTIERDPLTLSTIISARAPQTLYIDWTDYCNANCFFCYREIYEKQIGGKGEFIPFKKLKNLEKVLREITYFGISSGIGEPLLHPDLKAILDWLYEINPGIKIRTTTNGTALTGGKAAWFAGHLDWLSISLNAANADAHMRDMFPQLARRGIDAEKRWELHLRHLTEFVAALPAEDRPRIRFQAVAHRYNIQDLPDFVRVVARIGGSHAVITNIAAHAHTVDHSLYWVKDAYNDAVDEAAVIGCQLGVRVDAARFYTSVKPVLDLDKVCRDPIDIAYISRASVGAPCCQWAEAGIPIEVYDDPDGFDRYWNHDILHRLRQKRDFPSCRVCGMARVFDETSFHFSPKLKQELTEAGKISEIDSANDYPDAALVRRCVENRIDLPPIRRSLRSLDLPLTQLDEIKARGIDAVPGIEEACWEKFRTENVASGPIEIDLAGCFVGVGWGPPIHEPQHRRSARWIGGGQVASVFVRVPPGTEYQLCFVLHHVAPAQLLNEMGLAIGALSIELSQWTDDMGRTIISGKIPEDVVSAHGGRLWLRVGAINSPFSVAEAHISFERLIVSDTWAIEVTRRKRSAFAQAVIASIERADEVTRPVNAAILT